jgi:hypothetical protein
VTVRSLHAANVMRFIVGFDRSPLLPMRALRLLLLVALCGTTACLPFLHPGSADRRIDGTYTQVFEATRAVLEDRGFPLRTVNRETGTIVTGKRPVWLIETYRRVEKAEARIREDGNGVDVSLLLSFVDQVSGPPPPPNDDGDDDHTDDVVSTAVDRSLSASAIYDEYLDAIEDRVADMHAPPVVDDE